LVPLAGALLDLAERGGHLVLEARSTEQLPDLLAQAERLDLVRVVAQPTFGLLPGESAEYLLPLSGGVSESPGADTPLAQARPTGGTAGTGYLLWRLTPRWTEQGRWQLETILELGGKLAAGKEGSRTRLLAELEPGQTSAAGIPTEFYLGPGRLVVLTTPEMRTTPLKDGTNTPLKGQTSPSGRGHINNQYMGDNTPIGDYTSSISPQPAGQPIPKSSPETAQTSRAPPASGGPVAPSGIPGERESGSSAKSENLSGVPGGVRSPWLGGSPGAGAGASPMEKGDPLRTTPSGRGLLPKLGQLFRVQKEEKSGAAPGYTVAESPEPAAPQPMEIHVPEAPQPDSAGSRIIPRVVRPQTLR
jgi:hypothetical protein